MNRTERLYQLDKLLRANRCVSVERILEELGVSIATFKRDLEYLRSNLNAPIEWNRACNGYQFAETAPAGPRYELPGVWFNAGEIHALLTIEHLLKEIEPGILHEQFAMLRERLASLLGKPEAATQEIKQRIFIRSRFKRPTSPRFFEKTISALMQRHRLQIQHASRFTGENSNRVISPQRLIHYREVWYLVAWCHLREAVRTFALDNIQKAEVLAETAREVETDELDALMNTGYGIWAGKEAKWAKLRFCPICARWAASETWHSDQQSSHAADGSFILQIPYTHDDELIMDILKYGSGCTVLEPESLRAKVISYLDAARKNYS
jgi:predicted DNA-binding transcriptional regulator YafY